MPNEEETRLRATLTDCHVLSLDALYALTHAGHGVANDHGAYRKLVAADEIARENYVAARIAMKAYLRKNKLI